MGMQLFSKEKGIVWGIMNGILLAAAIVTVIGVLVIVIFGSLGGLGAGFFSSLISWLGAGGLIVLMLFMINKVLNLLDSSYPMSRKLFNGLILLSTLGGVITLWATLMAAFSSKSGISATVFITEIVVILAYVLILWIANAKPIMVKANSIALNLFNFFGLIFCADILALLAILLVNSVSISGYAANIYWRFVLLLALIFVGLLILIYALNKHSQNEQKAQKATMPSKFNDQPKVTESQHPDTNDVGQSGQYEQSQARQALQPEQAPQSESPVRQPGQTPRSTQPPMQQPDMQPSNHQLDQALAHQPQQLSDTDKDDIAAQLVKQPQHHRTHGHHSSHGSHF